MPANGEELQWVDEHSHTGYVPKGKYDNGINDNLASSEVSYCTEGFRGLTT